MHNKFKSSIGRLLGIHTSCVANVRHNLSNLVTWDKNRKYNEEITELIKVSNSCKDTTVYFNFHWIYSLQYKYN